MITDLSIHRHASPGPLLLATLLLVAGCFAGGVASGHADEGAATTTAQTTAGTVAASAQAAVPLPVGRSIPDVSLQTVDHQTFPLQAAVAKQPTVLIFYRGGWCPFCNAHLSALETIVDDLKGLGYQILAVTPDLPEKIAETIAKDRLTYTLLSDPSGTALKGFGVAYRLDDETFGKYKAHQLNLEAWSGNNAHLLPVPAVFVLDTKGTVRYVHANPDYKVRLAPADVLEAAKTAKAEAAH